MVGRIISRLKIPHWFYRLRFKGKIVIPLSCNINSFFRLRIDKDAQLLLDENVTILNLAKENWAGIKSRTSIRIGEKAFVKIGRGSGLSGAVLNSRKSIVIGERVQLGVNSYIYDHDFHSLSFENRNNPECVKSAPIVIEDDVWLGANVTVLKGVIIGKGSVVASGSLVTKSIGCHELWGGCPAKKIRSL